jgi:hypothetical protein
LILSRLKLEADFIKWGGALKPIPPLALFGGQTTERCAQQQPENGRGKREPFLS